MLRYFREGLQLSILAKLENEDLKLEIFVQIMKKAVVAKAKANLRPRAIAQDMDQQCTQVFRPANTTTAKASSQGQSIKDPWMDEPKAKNPE